MRFSGAGSLSGLSLGVIGKAYSNDDGCGLGANCNSAHRYNRKLDYGTSDLNQTNAFSTAFTLQLPFSKSSNKLASNVTGGWAFNGIVLCDLTWLRMASLAVRQQHLVNLANQAHTSRRNHHRRSRFDVSGLTPTAGGGAAMRARHRLQ